MARSIERRRADAAALPEWILSQLTQLVDAVPDDDQWLREIICGRVGDEVVLDPSPFVALTRPSFDGNRSKGEGMMMPAIIRPPARVCDLERQQPPKPCARERLAAMRAQLIARLDEKFDGGDRALLNSVQLALDAIASAPRSSHRTKEVQLSQSWRRLRPRRARVFSRSARRLSQRGWLALASWRRFQWL
jgi:hypothetical protein